MHPNLEEQLLISVLLLEVHLCHLRASESAFSVPSRVPLDSSPKAVHYHFQQQAYAFVILGFGSLPSADERLFAGFLGADQYLGISRTGYW